MVRIPSHRSKVEITCKSNDDAEALKIYLQRNQIISRINKILSFVKKSTLQKPILFSVPEAINFLCIIVSMENSYNFRLKVFHILRHQPSRSQTSKNWIILFALSLLKAIVKDGSLYIGPKQCKVSPYTSIKNFTNANCWPPGKMALKRYLL